MDNHTVQEGSDSIKAVVKTLCNEVSLPATAATANSSDITVGDAADGATIAREQVPSAAPAEKEDNCPADETVEAVVAEQQQTAQQQGEATTATLYDEQAQTLMLQKQSTPAAAAAPAAAPAEKEGKLAADEPGEAVVAEQQHPEQHPLEVALDKLTQTQHSPKLLFKEQEVTAVVSAVTGAITARTGGSVVVYGPAGSGKSTIVNQAITGWRQWCEQHSKPEPQICSVEHFDTFIKLLKNMKPEQAGADTLTETEARDQLQALFCATDTSGGTDAPIHLLRLRDEDYMDEEFLLQLLQLAHTANSRLMLLRTAAAKTDLLQTRPELQQLDIVPQQVVSAPYTESQLVAILRNRHLEGIFALRDGAQECPKRLQ
jgi:hypothetical protein